MAFAIIVFHSAYLGREVRDTRCTRCKHSSAQGQPVCILPWRQAASTAHSGIDAGQHWHFTGSEFLSVFPSTPTQHVRSDRACKRPVKTGRISCPGGNSANLTQDSTCEQPNNTDRSANTAHILLTTYTQTYTQTVWYQCENIAALVCAINITIDKRRRLSPKKQMLSFLQDLLGTATIGRGFYFYAYLIWDNPESPMWNCKQGQTHVQPHHVSNRLPKQRNHCSVYLILNWLIPGKASTSSVCPQHILKDYIHRYSV